VRPEILQEPYARPRFRGLAARDMDGIVTVRAGDDDDDVSTLHERNEAGATTAPRLAVVHCDFEAQPLAEGKDFALEAVQSAHECDASKSNLPMWASQAEELCLLSWTLSSRRLSQDLTHSSTEPASPSARIDLVLLLGANLRQLRTGRGLSLARLSAASGVSRAMLSQVELGKSTPTITVLWRITQALGIPFSSLLRDRRGPQSVVLRASSAKMTISHGGAYICRALFPSDVPQRAEFYELRLAPASIEDVEAHAPGTKENLVVAEGKVAVVVAGHRHDLESGDAMVFDADLPHQYRNDGLVEARIYLVVAYSGREPCFVDK
jgi:transcriptional regulator with XRE-family HTH domain